MVAISELPQILSAEAQVAQGSRAVITDKSSRKKIRPLVSIPNCRYTITLHFLMVTTCIFANASETDPNHLGPSDFPKLSMKALLNMEVTSVSRKPEKLSDAAAAVFVLSNDDIRRSGATTIADALRLVPGLQVARIDVNTWAVSARGFNSSFANKLLVLMDGRTVYSPIFSGAQWDSQDTFLEDIDRIEVIRGPGATLWGANAVNGVINIITRKSQDTQGTVVVSGGGTEERIFGGIRYGGELENEIFYRIYAKGFKRDDLEDFTGNDTGIDWDGMIAGFRCDWEINGRDSLTLQGDIYDETVVSTSTIVSLTSPPKTIVKDHPIRGGNILGRWTRSDSESSDLNLQIYYDRDHRESDITESRIDTFDIDFHHRFALAASQEIVWGLGYRLIIDHFDNTFNIIFDPHKKHNQLFSCFLQDSVTLIDEVLTLTLGSKFEHNDYTGMEIQPSIRFLWKAAERQTIWGAISRAVRTPARVDQDIRVNERVFPNPFHDSSDPDSPAVAVASFLGNDDFDSEELMAYEIGYRVQPADRLSLDIATFYNDYDNLRTLETGDPQIETMPAPLHLVFPVILDNKMDGETYGIEVAATWLACSWMQFHMNYSYQLMQLHVDNSSTDTLSEATEGMLPQQQAYFRSSFNMTEDTELDFGFRYVDNIPGSGINNYFDLDVRMAWQPSTTVELSVVGQNLLNSGHPELIPEFSSIQPAQLERGVYLKVRLAF